MSLPPSISSDQPHELPSLNDQIDTLVSGLSDLKQNPSLPSYEKQMYAHIFAALSAAFPSFPSHLEDILDHPENQEDLDAAIKQLKGIRLRPL